MQASFLLRSLLVLMLPTLANAQTWTSPDGFLSVTPPDEKSYSVVEAPPALFDALWMNADESIKFGVLKAQIPGGVKLVQSAAEEGLAEQIGGTVTRLPTKRLSGFEVWNMTATGPVGEITQAMVRDGDVVHKLMVVTLGNSKDQVSVRRFMDSLSIAERSNDPPTQPVAASAIGDSEDGFDFHALSKAFGGGGAMLGIGLLVYFVLRGKQKRPKK